MNAAAFDVNSACTSFLYSLNIATDMIKAGSITTALVLGVDKTSRFMNWRQIGDTHVSLNNPWQRLQAC